MLGLYRLMSDVSHSARGAWIETGIVSLNSNAHRSHSARGAWIETVDITSVKLSMTVALREGCVDRNQQTGLQLELFMVALREGCVDRNYPDIL